MGVDHEADPPVPDLTSSDHEEGPAFDVWATRVPGSTPAFPAAPAPAPEDDTLAGQAPGAPGDADLTGHVPDAPEHGAALPTRAPRGRGAGAALPRRAAAPEDAPTLSARTDRGQDSGAALPTPASRGQDSGAALPTPASRGQDSGAALPTPASRGQDGGPALPTRAPRGQDGGPALPTRGSPAAGGDTALPSRAPGGRPALPNRATRTASDGSALPARTARYRRTGRHSSPHQLSLPSDTPALVIAVPGSARPEAEDMVARIADQAGASCHGAEVRVGYLRGGTDSLDEVLDGLVSANGGPAAVVVPLLAFPAPEMDAAIADSVAAAREPFLIAAHLGPHPLLAEAVHARLADAGLARAARVGRISIVTAADGVIVGAAGDEEAIEGAGVVAVLLASRLTMPVAAASLTDPASIKDAANRLREARVGRVALAPCMIGPELTSGTLDAIAALTATDCAPPLGSHPAVAQLVAIRYGAALADPRVASMIAEAKGEPLPAAAPPSGAAT
jgi:sirohydrochlorin ferrochelatase